MRRGNVRRLLKRLFYGKPGSDRLPRLTDDERAWVIEQLADQIDGVQELLQVDMSRWKTAPTRTSPLLQTP